MTPLTDAEIRSCFVNASRSERQGATLPHLPGLDWTALDVLGWRDPRAPQRGYLVVPTDAGPTGVLLRAPESRVRRTAQCLLCRHIHQDNVALVVAKRAGASGRNGNTIGIYACADLQCSTHLRASLRPTRQLPDPAPVIAQRGEELRERAQGFVRQVLSAA